MVEQALKISQLMHVPAAVDGPEQVAAASDRLIGSGPAMQSICKQIGRISQQNVNVLVFGESGTGKELVARAIYHHSRRSQGPFLAINCAAIPESLLESELFGHEQGAFTGADHRRIGKFEQCNQGTIFLDEVGDMPLATQAKILRLVQDGQFQRVGGNETMTVDVRVIAATHQNLEAMIQAGRFRSDLYYRLRGVILEMPPLRERIEDLAELAHYFLFRFNRQLGTMVQSISPDVLDLFEAYSWPGNIRELQSVIRESLIASRGPTLLPDFMPPAIRREPGEEQGALPATTFLPTTWKSIEEFVNKSVEAGESDVYRAPYSSSTASSCKRSCVGPRATNRWPPKSWESAGPRCVTSSADCATSDRARLRHDRREAAVCPPYQFSPAPTIRPTKSASTWPIEALASDGAGGAGSDGAVEAVFDSEPSPRFQYWYSKATRK